MRLLSNLVKLYSRNKHINNTIVKMSTSTGTTTPYKTFPLSEVIQVFKSIAPLQYAASWDNVGLLLEPSSPHEVSTVLLTNDLTPAVLDEALKVEANFIYSYHPPIFRGIKSITYGPWKDKVYIRCLENRVAVFSSHTAMDAIEGGINDWLLTSFDIKSFAPIEPQNEKVEIQIENIGDHLQSQLKSIASISRRQEETSSTLLLKSSDINKVVSILNEQKETYKLKESVGMGRIGLLKEPVSIRVAIERVKTHLKLDHLRVALAEHATCESLIDTVAVCAGSGASIVNNVDAKLIITGEMSHHELLDATQDGKTVILCEHSNSERGYLKLLASTLSERLKGINVVVSNKDKDPILIV